MMMYSEVIESFHPFVIYHIVQEIASERAGEKEETSIKVFQSLSFHSMNMYWLLLFGCFLTISLRLDLVFSQIDDEDLSKSLRLAKHF